MQSNRNHTYEITEDMGPFISLTNFSLVDFNKLYDINPRHLKAHMDYNDLCIHKIYIKRMYTPSIDKKCQIEFEYIFEQYRIEVSEVDESICEVYDGTIKIGYNNSRNSFYYDTLYKGYEENSLNCDIIARVIRESCGTMVDRKDILNSFFEMMPWLRVTFELGIQMNVPLDELYSRGIFNMRSALRDIFGDMSYDNACKLWCNFNNCKKNEIIDKLALQTYKLLEDDIYGFSSIDLHIFSGDVLYNRDMIIDIFMNLKAYNKYVKAYKLAKALGYKINCGWSDKRFDNEIEKWENEMNMIPFGVDNYDLGHAEIYHEFSNKFSDMIMLKDNMSLKAEGFRQSNCVGERGSWVKEHGNGYFKYKGYTIQLSCSKVCDNNGVDKYSIVLDTMLGKVNSEPLSDDKEKIKEMIEVFNQFSEIEGWTVNKDMYGNTENKRLSITIPVGNWAPSVAIDRNVLSRNVGEYMTFSDLVAEYNPIPIPTIPSMTDWVGSYMRTIPSVTIVEGLDNQLISRYNRTPVNPDYYGVINTKRTPRILKDDALEKARWFCNYLVESRVHIDPHPPRTNIGSDRLIWLLDEVLEGLLYGVNFDLNTYIIENTNDVLDGILVCMEIYVVDRYEIFDNFYKKIREAYD